MLKDFLNHVRLVNEEPPLSKFNSYSDISRFTHTPDGTTLHVDLEVCPPRGMKDSGDGTNCTFSNRRGSVRHCDGGVREIPRRTGDGRGQDARFLEDEHAARHVLTLGSGLAH